MTKLLEIIVDNRRYNENFSCITLFINPLPLNVLPYCFGLTNVSVNVHLYACKYLIEKLVRI
jgi:hypothetical protein